ncbi:hypothetical protein LVJ94_02730 [Pendulispora rubella]|uniref:Uncharacterized protein n=1 Tax=Pendulispora rubella TaxID=2741070 RepID=A0ABZ2LBP6_9BACT
MWSAILALLSSRKFVVAVAALLVSFFTLPLIDFGAAAAGVGAVLILAIAIEDHGRGRNRTAPPPEPKAAANVIPIRTGVDRG